MNICELLPQPTAQQPFRRSRVRFVPESSGCYVLTNFSGLVLYVGLTGNLRRRMNEHLDNPEKTAETSGGRAVVFHWIESREMNKIERTWLNIHIDREGKLPILNRVYSPVSV